jgi:DNA-binding MarR family transcriptional regulator
MAETAQIRLKEVPRYDCLVEAARSHPDCDPSATYAFLNLLYTGDEVSALLEEHFADHGISAGRFRVLMLLFRDKPAGCKQADTPAELAAELGVSRATVTGLLDTLERDGFLRRAPTVTDRRQLTIALTSRGDAFMRRFLPGHFRLISGLAADMTEAERKTFVRLLAKLTARAGSTRAARTHSAGLAT